jgi:hypothetical protein
LVRPESQYESRISTGERRLLADIAAYPLSTVTERYERLGWTTYTGHRIKSGLLDKKLIAEEKISTPQGRVSLLKTTEKGTGILNVWELP